MGEVLLGREREAVKWTAGYRDKVGDSYVVAIYSLHNVPIMGWVCRSG